MRLFFAIDLLPEEAMGVADWRDRQLPADGRAVPPENFHITLAFIGKLEPRRLERLCAEVDNWRQQSRCSGGCVELDQVGYWPRPGIYWLGPSQWPSQLQQLALKLQNLGQRCGGKRESKAFRPHLTLFRGCQTPPPAPAQMISQSVNYRTFTLFESQSGRRGVRYHAQTEWPLD